MYSVGDIVKVNDGVFVDLFGSVVDILDLEEGCYITLLGEEDPMYFELDEIEEAKPRDYFEATVKLGLARETPFMFVLVSVPNCNDNELIINPLTNFEDKLNYYLETYDEELNHKYAQGVKIMGFGMSEALEFIEEQVYGEEDCEEFEETAIPIEVIRECIKEKMEDRKEINVGDKVRVVNCSNYYAKYNGLIGFVKEVKNYKYGKGFELEICGDNIEVAESKVERI